MLLLSNFTLSPPTPGVYCGGTGGGPLTRQTAYAHERKVLKVAEKGSVNLVGDSSPC